MRTRFASALRWFLTSFLLALLALAVKHAEEGQLFSAEAVWKALAFCALGALVQAVSSFVSACRRLKR